MNRLRKIGAALAVAGMLATYVPSGLVLAQVNPNSPIEVSVDILLQVDANPPKRQENATYEIVDEAGNVVYRHESDAQAGEVPKLTAGKYRLRCMMAKASNVRTRFSRHKKLKPLFLSGRNKISPPTSNYRNSLTRAVSRQTTKVRPTMKWPSKSRQALT